MLENFLTKTPEEFNIMMRVNTVPSEELDPRREAYRYAKVRHLLLFKAIASCVPNSRRTSSCGRN